MCISRDRLKMASPYLYTMQHAFDNGRQITMSFKFDPSVKDQDDKTDVGQDLSHFAHRARRFFMHRVYECYLQGITHERLEDELSNSAYFQHIKRLNLNIRSVTCNVINRCYNNQQSVSVQCYICLTKIYDSHTPATIVK